MSNGDFANGLIFDKRRKKLYEKKVLYINLQ